MTEDTIRTDSNYVIEFYDTGHEWKVTGSAPLPFSTAESPQLLPESVWVAYVDYLNAREKYAPTERRGAYRLTSYSTTTTKEVIHV